MKEGFVECRREMEAWVDVTAARAAVPGVIAIAVAVVVAGWRFSRRNVAFWRLRSSPAILKGNCRRPMRAR
jgi:hypothetical protein